MGICLEQAWNNSKYYRGGFEGKMSRAEAFRVLGLSSNTPLKVVNAQHKKIMLLNLVKKHLEQANESTSREHHE